MQQRTVYARTRSPTRSDRWQRDPRYSTHRWYLLAARIRRRDRYCVIVNGCGMPAEVADHIRPVYPGMPDSEFYDPTNLRGGCQAHNKLRAVMERTAGMQQHMVPSGTRDGSWLQGSRKLQGSGSQRSFSGPPVTRPASGRLHTRDYTRREGGR